MARVARGTSRDTPIGASVLARWTGRTWALLIVLAVGTGGTAGPCARTGMAAPAGAGAAWPIQEETPVPEQAKEAVPHGVRKRVDKATARLTEQLGLTGEQRVQVAAILQDQFMTLKELRGRTKGEGELLDPRQFKAEKIRLQVEADRRLEAVLTDDQRELYAPIKKERMEKMTARRQAD